MWGWVGILGFEGSNCGWLEMAGCPGQRVHGIQAVLRAGGGARALGCRGSPDASHAAGPPARPQGVAQGPYPGQLHMRRRWAAIAVSWRDSCWDPPPTNTCSEEVSVSQRLGPRTWRAPAPLTSLGPGSLLPLRRPTAFWRQVSASHSSHSDEGSQPGTSAPT